MSTATQDKYTRRVQGVVNTARYIQILEEQRKLADEIRAKGTDIFEASNKAWELLFNRIFKAT